MNDRWRDEICLEAECMFGEKEWSDGQRPGGVSFPSFSQQLCVLLQRRRLCWHLLQHASTNLYLLAWLLFWLHIFPLAQTFLEAWRSYLRMCKDEWTYLLEQKCPNTMCLQDHKSVIVNLGETKLPTGRIYFSCANGQITPEHWCHSLQRTHVF